MGRPAVVGKSWGARGGKEASAIKGWRERGRKNVGPADTGRVSNTCWCLRKGEAALRNLEHNGYPGLAENRGESRRAEQILGSQAGNEQTRRSDCLAYESTKAYRGIEGT